MHIINKMILTHYNLVKFNTSDTYCKTTNIHSTLKCIFIPTCKSLWFFEILLYDKRWTDDAELLQTILEKGQVYLHSQQDPNAP